MRYRIVFLLFGLLVLLTLCCFGGCSNQGEDINKEYGVFIGADPEDINRLFDYQLVIVDAEYYTLEEIELLHNKGVKVYSYLNVGAIETFRDDFAAYEPMILGDYENWPGEYWMDVSQPEWKNHMLKEAGLLAEKGVDGFFLDNIDVYYQYPSAEIFQGLIAIIKGLGQFQKGILINGGDVFVTEAILDAGTPMIQITGVNQECVFTGIDFSNDKMISQSPDTSRYYQAYLERCKEAGLSVYLTEYAENSKESLRKTLDEYCKNHQFAYYISPSVNLER